RCDDAERASLRTSSTSSLQLSNTEPNKGEHVSQGLKFVIRAGGVGTRLWPYSRQARPKQFHAMAGDRTMLQEAVDRILPIAGMDDIFVSTGTAQAHLVRQQLPQLRDDHLIVEPALRNTGPAVALECALLAARWPGCTIASLGSDHYIGKPDEFCGLLEAASAACEEHPEYLYTIGVKPVRPETGYGYIRKGQVMCRATGLVGLGGETPVYEVTEFTEKPDEATAVGYANSGEYLWNTNMFVWRADTVMDLFATHEPDIHERALRIGAASGEARALTEVIEREYPQMKAIAVDNAIIEPAPHVATLEGELNWGDIGSWAALTDVLAANEDGNLLKGNVVTIDSGNVTVYGGSDEKVVALVGVDDLVVVDTPDALLVCRKQDAQRVRDVLDRLQDGDQSRFA
ncbi:MAG: sugar phosphate nucleotidyltransferase, partial [Candidatus Latescibacterota bacterium]|nr:sugar phosphate nucleotidyltransferase [Candidatus Latescibacterota bacterium]